MNLSSIKVLEYRLTLNEDELQHLANILTYALDPGSDCLNTEYAKFGRDLLEILT